MSLSFSQTAFSESVEEEGAELFEEGASMENTEEVEDDAGEDVGRL